MSAIEKQRTTKRLKIMKQATITWPVFLIAIVSISRGADIDFARDIKPILSDNCYACHGPDEGQRQGGGDAGFRLDVKEHAMAKLDDDSHAIVPGDPKSSVMIERILSRDPDVMMPPASHRKKLNAKQKRLLVEWVRSGARWSAHWSYIPPEAVSAPRVKAQTANWVDQFVLADLQNNNLAPADIAERTILLRRVYFDLIGLPPEEDVVKSFGDPRNDDEWEKLVDHLLQSPHFGERMAMYWLDLVRYADTVGYHGDQDMSVSPFRDYVINAFNNNMPFDQFTHEQLAGDLIPNASQQQKIASGYNRLGMMSAEGGVQDKEYLAKYAAERVRNASTVWLGSTLGCAECHDHKFDPFTSKDFYRFASFFADIKEKGLYSGAHASGKWGPSMDVPSETLPQLLKPLDTEIAELTTVMQQATPELTAAQKMWESGLRANRMNWQTLKPASTTARHGTKLSIQKQHSVLASGPNGGQNTYVVRAKTGAEPVTGFRLEVLPHKSLPKNGPGRAGNGNFVLTEFRVQLNPDATDKPLFHALKNATASIEQSASAAQNPWKAWAAASAIDNNKRGANWGWAILPNAGKSSELVVQCVQPIPPNTELAIHLEQGHDNSGHTLGHFRVSTTSAKNPTIDELSQFPDAIQTAVKVDSAKRNKKQREAVAEFFRQRTPLLAKARKQLAKVKSRREKLVKENTRSTLITVAVKPREMRVLPRGNWMDMSGDVVAPGVPHFLPQIESNSDRANRADLAQWLTAADNPLTARVFVNRLWKLMFGTGLSKVLDDLGSQGEPPSHPQLLDNLAVEFVESGWNVKHMVKLLVMSRTYRQSSYMRSELAELDPFNRLLARQSRFRLDAEVVRDNALAVSGLLVSKLGGRSVKPYQPPGLYRHLNFPRRTYKHDSGDSQYRRGLYTHWQRQFLHPAMKAFDAPSREECTAERPRSNTPLAALVMLNDPSYVEAARVLAENTIRTAKTDEARAVHLFRRTLTRQPNARELGVLQQLFKTESARFQANETAAKELISTGQYPVPQDIPAAELATWTTVARAVMNMHEFITRN